VLIAPAHEMKAHQRLCYRCKALLPAPDLQGARAGGEMALAAWWSVAAAAGAGADVVAMRGLLRRCGPPAAPAGTFPLSACTRY
jgi:hypothetical protein